MPRYDGVMSVSLAPPPPVTWSWLGGRPALDLVNTLRDRAAAPNETLRTPADLGAWLAAAGLLEAAGPPPVAVLEEARELRAAIDAVVTAIVDGATVPARALTRIDDWLVHAGSRPRVTLGSDGLPVLGERPPADSPRRALGTIALDAAVMLGTPAERARLRICASETCGTRFFDRSPASGRRWCSMRTCGNEAKARRHRERERAAR
jgi:predicted RNA-binding Zn ribbon-like protein